MSANNTQAMVVAPSNAPVKFFGRSCEVNHNEEVYVQALQKLVVTTNELRGIAHRDDSWSSLATEMTNLTNHFMNPQSNIKRFQVELTTDGLLPYLKKLNGRLHFDPKRFNQINSIIHAIMNNDNTHPALTLQALDEVIWELKSTRSYIWKSELLTYLETATDKQWQPIIADNRSILQYIGGKFLVIGLIGVIGWPLAFMYPLYRVALNMSRIATEYEKEKCITMESGIEVAKTLVIVFAATQLLSILNVYASLGHFCLFCGLVALILSSNKTLIKHVAPAMAPHVVQVDMVLNMIGSIDHTKISGLMMNHAAVASGATTAINNNNNNSNNNARNTTATAAPISDRVEELPTSSQSSKSVKQTNVGGSVKANQSTRSSSKKVSPAEYVDLTGDDLMDVIDADKTFDPFSVSSKSTGIADSYSVSGKSSKINNSGGIDGESSSIRKRK